MSAVCIYFRPRPDLLRLTLISQNARKTMNGISDAMMEGNLDCMRAFTGTEALQSVTKCASSLSLLPLGDS